MLSTMSHSLSTPDPFAVASRRILLCSSMGLAVSLASTEIGRVVIVVDAVVAVAVMVDRPLRNC